MSRPRKVYVIQTEYFDILFSKESKETADLLASLADALYLQAEENSGVFQKLHIPVVISPDSDSLSVTYTQLPYNRIVIFDSVATFEDAKFKDNLLGLFYHEVYYALVKGVKSPLHQNIAKIAGQLYEPMAVLNMPFSFIEGRVYLEEGAAADSDHPDFYGRYNDGYFLQILSQAKLDGEFPDYYECSALLDINPGNNLLYAATSAFYSYLIQAYGIKKFNDFWMECGDLHFYLMPGIFYKIYKQTLRSVWKDFEESVPLPDDLEEMNVLKTKVNKLFEKDREGLYRNLLISDYGLIWYDDIRHEVSLYDKNSKIKIRQLLFFADKVDSLKLSLDGRYLAVSFRQIKNRSEFEEKVTWIYDLKERSFLKYELNLTDAAFLLSSDGRPLVCGVNVQKKYPEIQIYALEEDAKTSLIYQKSFDKNAVPSSVCPAGNGKVCFIITKENNQILCLYDFESGKENYFKLYESEGQDLNFTCLRAVQSKGQSGLFTFQYVPRTENAFTRYGLLKIDENLEISALELQKTDLPGGVNFPCISEKYLIYSSQKVNHNELCFIEKKEVELKSGSFEKINPPQIDYEEKTFNFSKKELNGKKLSGYWPLKYMFPASCLFFLPVREISVDQGPVKWPGLGLTFTTQSDPFMNNRFDFSAGCSFLPMDFTKIINAPLDFILSEEQESRDWDKNKSLAAFFENTSTPVDIKAGAILKFNLDGEYDFEAVAGTAWNIPKGMNFSNIKINLQTTYKASTDYYDYLYYDLSYDETPAYPSLSGWPSFSQSYETLEFSALALYTNIHQSGMSPYEKRGFSFGARFYSFWDLYTYRGIEKYRKELTPKIGQMVDGEILTQEKLNEQFDFMKLRFSQLNLGLVAQVALPRLTPLQNIDGLILSLPVTINIEFLNKAGKALQIKPEVLLFGWEIHNGISPLQLYFSRLGVKGGYNFSLDYDTKEVMLPDIRREDYLGELFNSTYINDFWYLTLNIDASSPVGILSEESLSFNFTVSFYPKTKGYVLDFVFSTSF